MLQDVRCSGCSRLLFRIEEGALAGALSVKWTGCWAFDHLRSQPGLFLRDAAVRTEGGVAPCKRCSSEKGALGALAPWNKRTNIA
jgi:phage FluMu protein Com